MELGTGAPRFQGLGARIGTLHPAGPLPCLPAQQLCAVHGPWWLTVDGAVVRAIFPARWACIAPSFSFSSSSCECGHKVKLQPGLFSSQLCPAYGLAWDTLPPSFLPSFMPSPILSETSSWHRVDIRFAHQPPTTAHPTASPAALETALPPSGGDIALCPSHPADGPPGSA